MKVAVNGFALAAADTTTQKVYVHFKLARANNTSGSWVTVELPAGYASLGDSHSASVIAPSLQQLTGYDKEWVFSEASLYVVKGGERSNSLPIRYCSSNPMAPKPSIPGTC